MGINSCKIYARNCRLNIINAESCAINPPTIFISIRHNITSIKENIVFASVTQFRAQKYFKEARQLARPFN